MSELDLRAAKSTDFEPCVKTYTAGGRPAGRYVFYAECTRTEDGTSSAELVVQVETFPSPRPECE